MHNENRFFLIFLPDVATMEKHIIGRGGGGNKVLALWLRYDFSCTNYLKLFY